MEGDEEETLFTWFLPWPKLSCLAIPCYVCYSPAYLVKRSEPHGEWEEDLTQGSQSAQAGGIKWLNQQACLAIRTSLYL